MRAVRKLGYDTRIKYSSSGWEEEDRRQMCNERQCTVNKEESRSDMRDLDAAMIRREFLRDGVAGCN